MASYEQYESIFDKASQTYGVDKNLLLAVAKTESNFNPNATSSVGAKGIMQLMDATAKELGVTDSYNPEQNIMGGAKYLRQLLDRYNGDTTKALASYNGGMGNVDKYGASKYSNYYNKVYSNLELMSSENPLQEAEDKLKQEAQDIIDDADKKLEEHYSMYSFLELDNIVNIIFSVLIAIVGIVFIGLSIATATGQTDKVKTLVKTAKNIKKGKIKVDSEDVNKPIKDATKEVVEGVKKGVV